MNDRAQLRWVLFLLLLAAAPVRAQEADEPYDGPTLEGLLVFIARGDAPPIPALRVPELGATLGGARIDVDPATAVVALTDTDFAPRTDGSLGLVRTHGAFRSRSGHFGRGARTDLDAQVRVSQDGKHVTVERPEGLTLFAGRDREGPWRSVGEPGVAVERLVFDDDGGFTLSGGARSWSFHPDGTLRAVEPGFVVERANRTRLRLRASDGEVVVLDLDEDQRIVTAGRGGTTVRYRYGQDGRLAEVSGGVTRRILHDPRGRLARVETPAGVAELTHDWHQRVLDLVIDGVRRSYGGNSQPGSRMIALVRVEGPDGVWTAQRAPGGWSITGPDGVARLESTGGPSPATTATSTPPRKGLVGRLAKLGDRD